MWRKNTVLKQATSTISGQSMAESKSHYHYEVTGYMKMEKNKMLYNSVAVTLEADSEEEALRKAKKMIKKKFYRIAKVWECLETHGMQAEMQMLQLEMQKKLYDLIKPSG